MNVVRNIAGVFIGYFIFAGSAIALFIGSGVDAHAEATTAFTLGVIAYGGFFAFAGGYVGKLIASRRAMIPNYVLAVIMAGFAAISLFMSPGSHYTQVAAIFLFAPLSLVGGFLRRRSEI